MNWLDWLLIIMLAGAAIRGFMRGFIVETCSLLGLIIGIWAGVHLNTRVAGWLGLDPHKEALSFLITLIGVIVLVHLLGRALTKAIDMAQLGLPNKVAGVFFGMLRSAFVISVLLNILMAHERGSAMIPKETREGSKLYEPLSAFAPLIVPALRGTKWVKRAIEEVKTEVGKAVTK